MVLNGMIANQTTFNTGFVSRTAAATSTAAILSLLNTAIASGASVNNVQALLNKIIEGLGTTGETDANINNYSSNKYVADGRTRKQAIEDLDNQLFTTQTDLDTAEANIASAQAAITSLNSSVNTINNLPSTFAGDKTFTNDVTVNGNFTVNGTTTTVNSATVDSVDPNVTVNKNGSNATAEGAGFTVDRVGTKGSFVYQNTLASRFKVGDLGAETEVVTVSHNQTLTNKTLTSPIVNGGTLTTVSLVTPNLDVISATEQGSTPATPAAGVRKIYAKADGLYQLNSAGLETKVGSGSGGGGVTNLITDGDAEAGITSYVEGSYAAATRPAGTFAASSGAGALAISTTATNPINNTNSFLITKSAGASRQGRAIERTITLDREYRTKVLKMRVKFSVVSGTFVAGVNGASPTDSSMIFYIGQFNGTTWTYTEPSSFKALSSSSIVDYVDGTFQVNSDTTQIKLISYVAETANSAWVLMCEYEISPSTYTYGTPITAWQPYTPTFTGLGTVTGIDVRYRLVGESVEIEGRFTSGTVTGATMTITLPAGLVGSPTSAFICGDYGTQGTTTGSAVVYNNATNVLFFGMANWGVAATGTQVATGGFNSFNAKVPIQGLGAVTRMSDGYEGRTIAMKVFKTSNQSLTSGVETQVTAWGVPDDETASFNPTTGVYTVPSSGWYEITGSIAFASSGIGQRFTRLIKNGTFLDYGTLSGVPYTGGDTSSVFTFLTKCVAGNTLAIGAFQNSGGALVIDGASNTATHLSIKKLQGSQTISASEAVNCRYATSAAPSIPNATNTTLTFGTKDYDTHGGMIGNTYTCPVAGKYRVSGSLYYAATAGTSSDIQWNVAKNGTVIFGTNAPKSGTAAVAVAVSGSGVLSCNAGDLITIVAFQSTGGALSLIASGGYNWVAIEKVG